MDHPFAPHQGTNQNVTTGAASASISLDKQDKCVRIVNTGATNPAYIRFGVGAQTATSADFVVLPGTAEILYKGDGIDTLAYLQHTGTTALSICTGNGGV